MKFQTLVKLLEKTTPALNMELFRTMQYRQPKMVENELLSMGKQYGFDLINFLMGVNLHQNSQTRFIDAKDLLDLYKQLPEDIRKKYSPSPEKMKNAYRGDDLSRKKQVLSFMWHTNPQTAKNNVQALFGDHVFSLNDLSEYDGIFDPGQFVSDPNNNQILQIIPISDDENELLVMEPVWKNEILKNQPI